MKSKSNWLVSGIVGGLVFAAAVFVYRGTPTRPAYTRPAKRLVRIAPAVELATVLDLGDRTGAAHEAYHDAVVGLADLAVAALVRRLEREEVETLTTPFPGKIHEHVLAGAKLARYGAEYPGADGLALRGDEHRGVAVEADRAAIGAVDLLGRANDHGAVDVALLDAATGDRLLDGHDDDVADRGAAAARTAQELDALNPAGAGVVGHIEVGLRPDHDAAVPSAPASVSEITSTAPRRM